MCVCLWRESEKEPACIVWNASPAGSKCLYPLFTIFTPCRPRFQCAFWKWCCVQITLVCCLSCRWKLSLLELVLVLWLGLRILAVCPSVCSCSRSHREVDCSSRGLRSLPNNLQYNLRSLNLSHNRFHSLDDQLTAYTHLRVLDLSHNRLSRLPANLPRSLWRIYASSNRIQLLDKNDTVYQWNLQLLDLSDNKMERATFINNTLTSLCTLNLSHNHFWTLPTNLPVRLEILDLSHNWLVKVLPGSLDRLPRLTYFYLHANRFSAMPLGVLDKMTSLKVIALGNNPWACHLYADISYLLSWTQRTPARVLGCPCHTQPVCGGVRPGRTGGWHYASYNLPPLAASAKDLTSMTPKASVTGWWYLSVSTSLNTPVAPRETWDTKHHTFTATPSISMATLKYQTTGTHLTIDHMSASVSSDSLHVSATKETSTTDTSLLTEMTDEDNTTSATDQFFTTDSLSIQTKKTTTLRTRSVRRQNPSFPGGIPNSSPALVSCSWDLFLHSSALLSLILIQVHWKTNEKAQHQFIAQTSRTDTKLNTAAALQTLHIYITSFTALISMTGLSWVYRHF